MAHGGSARCLLPGFIGSTTVADCCCAHVFSHALEASKPVGTPQAALEAEARRGNRHASTHGTRVSKLSCAMHWLLLLPLQQQPLQYRRDRLESSAGLLLQYHCSC